ncbi:MAG: protein-glutamine glutaminase family protein [Gemmataceae bacterium]
MSGSKRWRALSLVVLLAAVTALAPAANETAPARGKAAVVTTSTVYYREKGSTSYSLFGYYVSEPSARQVFNHLATSGYEVELRISNTPIPKVGPPPSTPQLPKGETISLAKANEVFKWLAGQTDLAFRYPTDGCYARAHLMCERLQKQGFKPRKIWSVANGEELYARTKYTAKGYVTWAYHVAPMVRVRLDGEKQKWYVLDPSLFDGPVTLRQWMLGQMRRSEGHRPYLTLTAPGEAPQWLDGAASQAAATGRAGIRPRRAHALATMKKYKQREPRQPVRGAFPPPWADPPPAWHSHERRCRRRQALAS